MTKLIFKIGKQVLLFLLILLCAYLIFLTLEGLNDLVFHSYKTKRVFWPFDNQYFLDIDLMVKYAEHFWDIIAKSLVAFVLIFGAIIPYFTKLYSVVKKHLSCKNLSKNIDK